ncbi:RHS repeat-associated core domain-containing protein [Chitinophaga silvisoli]|uniref:Pierisin-like domain-containing protein n=1 Tax=Chitinophaga silvisoli TaxID=2291814 RepID=A0A3E1NMW8_9BACT|nr:RHS repeat-associated core domain-containing protein [Chitinophaga silvisoli]RFM29270.1 hypothetical protein DXN04_33535 [Chitinophaga silvisoli]
MNGDTIPATLTVTQRSNNTPETYMATQTISFEGEFSSGTADEFTTLFVDQTSADAGTESGISYGIVAKGYRYGFNGKENDNEVKGEGNGQDYGMRIYDPRVAKFLSIDPLTSHYPYYSPYQFAGNKPIMFVDLDGLEVGIPTINKFKYGDNIALNVISLIDNGGVKLLNFGIGLINSTIYIGSNASRPGVIINQTKSEFQELAKNVKKSAESTLAYHTRTPWKQQLKDAGYQLASAEQWETVSTFAVGMAVGKMDFSIPEIGALHKYIAEEIKFAGEPKLPSDIPKYVYRFDTRPPAEIEAAGGFESWGKDMSVNKHTDGWSVRNRTSGFVATTNDPSVLDPWIEGYGEGYIYKIRTPANAINVNTVRGADYGFGWEKEILIPLKVPFKRIVSSQYVTE